MTRAPMLGSSRPTRWKPRITTDPLQPDVGSDLRSALEDAPVSAEAGPPGDATDDPGPNPGETGPVYQETDSPGFESDEFDVYIPQPNTIIGDENSHYEHQPQGNLDPDYLSSETGENEGEAGSDEGDGPVDEESDEPAGQSASGSDTPAPAGDTPYLDKESIRLTPEREVHILYGDDKSGGHRSGAKKPDKTEFPASWTDPKILQNVLDVARNPDIPPSRPGGNRWLAEGVRDGVHITVWLEPDGRIVTAWPREGDPGVVRNPVGS
jgi:hypothetical protein